MPAPSLNSWPARHWADVSTRDFAAAQASGLAARTVAVLPVAAVEQHGPHLPLSVDATLLQGVVAAALAQLPADLPVLFLPPQAIGLSTEHLSYPGTLTLSPATLIALWSELGACVARAGVKKLLLLNGHGGNVAAMDIVARELRQRHGLLTYSASWFSLPLPDAVQGLFSAQEHRFGIHGGEIETSMMLHLAPATVHMEEARTGAPPRRTALRRMPSWATAAAPRWAGPSRITTRRAPWATRQRLPPPRGRPWCRRQARRWRTCCRSCMRCPCPRWARPRSRANSTVDVIHSLPQWCSASRRISSAAAKSGRWGRAGSAWPGRCAWLARRLNRFSTAARDRRAGRAARSAPAASATSRSSGLAVRST